ncbi:hypothetical protein [Paenibacillus alkalitolerans]|uniref:hypothetical protein n=1 Tax=Paenibacillus alkalitolerans TaxID=2799335 RepID=UPI0018F6E129|nr:hypothetical protein [Paenibacillus alkalitolerans]
MRKSSLVILVGLAAVELVSFQLGEAWFWPFNATLCLTVLISIAMRLRRMEETWFDDEDGGETAPIDAVVLKEPQAVEASEATEATEAPQQQEPPKPPYADDPPITKMKDIFPYARHDRSRPYD